MRARRLIEQGSLHPPGRRSGAERGGRRGQPPADRARAKRTRAHTRVLLSGAQFSRAAREAADRRITGSSPVHRADSHIVRAGWDVAHDKFALARRQIEHGDIGHARGTAGFEAASRPPRGVLAGQPRHPYCATGHDRSKGARRSNTGSNDEACRYSQRRQLTFSEQRQCAALPLLDDGLKPAGERFVPRPRDVETREVWVERHLHVPLWNVAANRLLTRATGCALPRRSMRSRPFAPCFASSACRKRSAPTTAPCNA
jgi:hypothetical protein